MILTNSIKTYERFVVHLFGYKLVIHLEEVILLLAGLFLGMLVMALLAGNFIYRLYKIEDMGKSKIQLLRTNHDGKTKYVAAFKSFSETIEQILLLSFSPFFTVKRYTLRDEQRTKRFLIIMSIIAAIVICFAIISVSTVFEPIPLTP
ncbi:MAG: hypothetical protein K0S71_599 [Clostridia bacterium]|nr:hypothetical protein [Clostridia bacterium]